MQGGTRPPGTVFRPRGQGSRRLRASAGADAGTPRPRCLRRRPPALRRRPHRRGSGRALRCFLALRSGPRPEARWAARRRAPCEPWILGTPQGSAAVAHRQSQVPPASPDRASRGRRGRRRGSRAAPGRESREGNRWEDSSPSPNFTGRGSRSRSREWGADRLPLLPHLLPPRAPCPRGRCTGRPRAGPPAPPAAGQDEKRPPATAPPPRSAPGRGRGSPPAGDPGAPAPAASAAEDPADQEEDEEHEDRDGDGRGETGPAAARRRVDKAHVDGNGLRRRLAEAVPAGGAESGAGGTLVATRFAARHIRPLPQATYQSLSLDQRGDR